MLLIQQYYNLSDPELELSVNDRISFRQFVGLKFEDAVPDETTMVRFRQRLVKANCLDKLLMLANEQLQKHDLFVRQATIIDATLVESATKRPVKDTTSIDKDAGWTVKRGKACFGYKGHISVDSENNLVEKVELTAASVHDSNVFEELLPEDTQSVYADKAYASEARSKKLNDKNIKNCIHNKAYRNHPMSNEKILANIEKSKIRTDVERVFAHWKRWYHYTRVRYIGRSKNKLQLILLSIAYNLKRSTAILMG